MIVICKTKLISALNIYLSPFICLFGDPPVLQIMRVKATMVIFKRAMKVMVMLMVIAYILKPQEIGGKVRKLG